MNYFRIVLSAILIFSTHIANAQSVRSNSSNKFFEFDDTPLSKILQEVCVYYKVTYYEPYNVVGIPVSGRIRKSDPVDSNCVLLTRIESGHAYLLFRNGVIYVSAR